MLGIHSIENEVIITTNGYKWDTTSYRNPIIDPIGFTFFPFKHVPFRQDHWEKTSMALRIAMMDAWITYWEGLSIGEALADDKEHLNRE